MAHGRLNDFEAASLARLDVGMGQSSVDHEGRGLRDSDHRGLQGESGPGGFEPGVSPPLRRPVESGSV